MKYKNIVEGVFVSRPNRFIANVVVDGVEQIVHVKNTAVDKSIVVIVVGALLVVGGVGAVIFIKKRRA